MLVVWHLLSDDWAEDKAWAKRQVFSIRTHPISVVSILRVTIASTAAFFSHTLVDGFAIFTYHPWKDQGIFFNQIWTPSILIAAGVVAIFALRKDFRFAWGIVFALAFDLWDYSVIRVINVFDPIDLSAIQLHHFEWAFIATFLFWAPNFYQLPLAALVEIVLIAILFMFWYVLAKRSPMPEKKPVHPNTVLFIIICGAFGFWLALPYII